MSSKVILLASSGTLLIALGLGALLGLPFIIRKIVTNEIIIAPNSQGYALWKDIPVPIYQRFYFFNVTNGHEIERTGAKPILQEIGPFTYRARYSKREIDFLDNGTVSFKENKRWTFVPSLSVASEDTPIITLNAPLAITLTLIQTAPPAVRVVVTLALDGLSEGFFIPRSPRQLLFEGYPDLLTTFGPLLNPEIPNNANGRFGYLYGRNNTNEGPMSVFTGATDIEKLNVIDNFRGSPTLPYWSGEECNSLNGSTNAEIFPPLLDDEHRHTVKLFYPDFCRVWLLHYNSTFDVGGGLQAMRYLPDINTFKNGRDYPPNSCYKRKHPIGQNPAINQQRPPSAATSLINSPLNPINLIGSFVRGGQQPGISTQRPSLTGSSSSQQPAHIRTDFPSGAFDLSACKYGAPIMMSYPHFFGADPSYLKAVDGLKPNASLHQFYVDIEPRTGTTVGLAGRVQINIAINKAPGLFRYRHIPDMVFPIFWQELSVVLTDDLTSVLKWATQTPGLVTSISSTIFFALGGLVLLTALLLPCYRILFGTKLQHATSPLTDSKSLTSDHTSINSSGLVGEGDSVGCGIDGVGGVGVVGGGYNSSSIQVSKASKLTSLALVNNNRRLTSPNPNPYPNPAASAPNYPDPPSYPDNSGAKIKNLDVSRLRGQNNASFVMVESQF